MFRRRTQSHSLRINLGGSGATDVRDEQCGTPRVFDGRGLFNGKTCCPAPRPYSYSRVLQVSASEAARLAISLEQASLAEETCATRFDCWASGSVLSCPAHLPDAAVRHAALRDECHARLLQRFGKSFARGAAPGPPDESLRCRRQRLDYKALARSGLACPCGVCFPFLSFRW